MSDTKQKPIRMTLCEGCPCLNNDYEQGGSCNLGYNADLVWLPDGSNCVYAASDCKLGCVQHGGKTLVQKMGLVVKDDPRPNAPSASQSRNSTYPAGDGECFWKYGYIPTIYSAKICAIFLQERGFLDDFGKPTGKEVEI